MALSIQLAKVAFHHVLDDVIGEGDNSPLKKSLQELGIADVFSLCSIDNATVDVLTHVRSDSEPNIPVNWADKSMLKAFISYVDHVQKSASPLSSINDWANMTQEAFDEYRMSCDYRSLLDHCNSTVSNTSTPTNTAPAKYVTADLCGCEVKRDPGLIHFSEGQKDTVLENVVAPTNELLCQVNTNLEKTRIGHTLDLEESTNLLLSTAVAYDDGLQPIKLDNCLVHLFDCQDDNYDVDSRCYDDHDSMAHQDDNNDDEDSRGYDDFDNRPFCFSFDSEVPDLCCAELLGGECTVHLYKHGESEQLITASLSSQDLVKHGVAWNSVPTEKSESDVLAQNPTCIKKFVCKHVHGNTAKEVDTDNQMMLDFIPRDKDSTSITLKLKYVLKVEPPPDNKGFTHTLMIKWGKGQGSSAMPLVSTLADDDPVAVLSMPKRTIS